MSSRFTFLLLCAALGVPSPAQTNPSALPDVERRSRALRELQESARKPAARESAAQVRMQREMQSRLAEFANSWNKLVTTVEKGVWNAKQARKTREAFEKLVHSAGWLEDRGVQARAEAPLAHPAASAADPARSAGSTPDSPGNP